MGTRTVLLLLLCVALAEAFSAFFGTDQPDFRAEISFMSALVLIGLALILLDLASIPPVAMSASGR